MGKRVDEIVAGNLFGYLETLIAKDQTPWNNPMIGAGVMPGNYVGGNTYRGINIGMAWSHAAALGYRVPQYVTFRNVRGLGGFIMEKEIKKPLTLVFAKGAKYKTIINDKGKEETVMVRKGAFRYYRAWNIDQIEWPDAVLDSKKYQAMINPPTPKTDADFPAEEVWAVINGYFAAEGAPTLVRSGSPQAWYQPSTDTVHIPLPAVFTGPCEEASVAVHEVSHSTKPRLKRKVDGDNLQEKYSAEECVAEITAAIFAAKFGFINKTIHNSAAYIGTWMKNVVAKQPTVLLDCFSQAQKAVDYIEKVADCG